MKIRKIKNCQKHGDTEHALRVYKTKETWKCLKCEAEAVQKCRDKIKRMALAYKGGKCQCCGYNSCAASLEFHHIDPNQKEFSLGHDGCTRSWERNKEELDKCILVCANCHREIHAGVRPCPTDIIADNEAVENLIF